MGVFELVQLVGIVMTGVGEVILYDSTSPMGGVGVGGVGVGPVHTSSGKKNVYCVVRW